MSIMANLSNRQKEVAILLSQGKSHKQIAAELQIAVSTVRHYLERARDRTGCATSMELGVKCAMELSGTVFVN